MRYIIYVIISVITITSSSIASDMIISTVPEKPDTNAKYLFYMHGKDIDEGRWGAKKYYQKNVKALSKLGFIVITEARPKGAIKKWPSDHEKYAKKVVNDVNKLLEAGVPARNIIVSGFSRGGTLTVITSIFINNSDIGFIIMAGCVAEDGQYKKGLPFMREQYLPYLKGRFLSLRDSGDEDFGSCFDYFSRASVQLDYKEITLSTGKGHNTFGSPMDEWLEPIAEWAGVHASKN